MALDVRLIEGQTAHFSAMGTSAEITVWGSNVLVAQLAKLAPLRVEILEQSWSRFRTDSELNEINRLNCADSIEVSGDLAELLNRMKDASQLTDHAYYPHVKDLMEYLGYDQSFENVSEKKTANTPLIPTIGNRDFLIQDRVLSFDQPVHLDPGGIGKGLAGDIICREFMALGAVGVLVNLGGDLVAAGLPGNGNWRLGITDDSNNGRQLGIIESTELNFAVATSSVVKRSWGIRHHIIDPSLQDSADSDISQVTVISSHGWKSEAFAKSALLKGFSDAKKYLDDLNLSYLLVSKFNEVSAKGVAIC